MGRVCRFLSVLMVGITTWLISPTAASQLRLSDITIARNVLDGRPVGAATTLPPHAGRAQIRRYGRRRREGRREQRELQFRVSRGASMAAGAEFSPYRLRENPRFRSNFAGFASEQPSKKRHVRCIGKKASHGES